MKKNKKKDAVNFVLTEAHSVFAVSMEFMFIFLFLYAHFTGNFVICQENTGFFSGLIPL
jgi:hypothetical protein